jgi:hypothetical protein
MIARFAHFVGRLVGVCILFAVAAGLFILTFALMGCSSIPNNLYLVRTLAGNYCVEASSYVLSEGGCAQFYRGTELNPQATQVATFCSIVTVEYTAANRCKSRPEAE